MTVSFLHQAIIWQPMLHKGQVVTVSASGLPSHLRVFSESAPVGQASTQAPQKVQPASMWVRLNAVPTTASEPRWV